LRQIILRLNLEGGLRELLGEARGLVAVFAKAVLNKSFGKAVEGIAAAWELHATETTSWVTHEALSSGRGGPFDACDLLCWLALAERAGVAAVPALSILSLSEADMSAASGTTVLPGSGVLRRRVAEAARNYMRENGIEEHETEEVSCTDELRERLMAAMDDVPEGWMVRHVRAGPSSLKSLAGCGIAGPQAPEVRFGPDLEIGPGWVRLGNRRMVDTKDKRIVEAAAQGPEGQDSVFVARPWLSASRWIKGDDVHRANGPLAGPGLWPAEWRAFAVAGRVTGVAFYYGWAGLEPNVQDAATALEVKRLAQLVVDEAVAQGAWPRYMDIEFMRSNPRLAAHADPAVRDCLADYGREQVACTLDFIETEQGLVLLEGGPAASPIGGGHPCAFAGAGGRPTVGNRMLTEGVAFRPMPQVILADPGTWNDGDRTGCILSWEEVEELAEQIKVPAESAEA
jgi:hypothetical protein